jgi:hypothetical protein
VLCEVAKGARLLVVQFAHDGRQDEAFDTLPANVLLDLLEAFQVIGVYRAQPTFDLTDY